MLDQPTRINRSLRSLRLALVATTATLMVGASVSAQTVTPVARQPHAADTLAESVEAKRARRSSATAASEVATSAAETKQPAADADGPLGELRQQIKETKPGPARAQLQKQLVESLVASDRKAEALDELRLMLLEDRYDPAFFYNIGNSLARLGDPGAAVDAYRKAISQRRGNYARALNNLGVILMRQGRWDEAHDALAAALTQENFSYAEASYNLGRLHLLRGEGGLAIKEWKRTLHLQPDHAEAAAALARLYANDGNPRRGLEVIDAFAARSMRAGDTTPVNLALARREVIESANADEASRDNDNEARSNGGTSTGAGVGSGPRTSAGPRPAGSLPSFSVDQTTYDLLQSARDAREQGRYEIAVKHYRGVIARSRGQYFAPANLELALALLNLRHREEAVAALLVVTERDGARYPIAHFHLARLYESLGQLDRAAHHFNRAVALYGDQNPQATLNLSSVYEKQGDAPRALAAMESYVRMMQQQGRVPDWTNERLAKLKEKAAASATQATAPKP